MSKRVQIAGIPFDPVRYEDALTVIESYLKDGKRHLITTPNPEMVLESRKNDELKAVLQASNLSVPDGIGILWAAYYLSLPRKKSFFARMWQLKCSLFKVLIRSKTIRSVLPERVTGSDLLFKIVNLSQQEKWRIFLLGAAPGVGKVAIERLNKKYPQAIFAGSFAGTPAKSHEDELCQLIDKSGADILFVAYGSPAQEIWIHRNLEKLSSVKVAIGVGGAIDFAAGVARRAPVFLRKIGLEWLWRVLLQPSRIRRIWNATVRFPRMMYGEKYR
jgi:N-acetylglucosaminyldiphosphoundecaprenol N-acetyl-beta-D-mannosaminyltransferase